METKKPKHPVFKGEHEIVSSLGEGNTSKVYLVRSIKEPKKANGAQADQGGVSAEGQEIHQ